jgi:hypothetical protein
MSIVFEPGRDWGWPLPPRVQPRACNCTGRGLDGKCDCERGRKDEATEAMRRLMERMHLRAFKPRYRVKAGREVVA